MLVDYLGQFAETLDIPVIVNAVPPPPAGTQGVINNRGLDYQQADAAPGDGVIEGLDFLIHLEFVLVPVEHGRTRFHHPVPRLYRADIAGFQQLFKP